MNNTRFKSCSFRRTDHNEPLYMDPGTCYVYMTYGMYHCMNISSKGDGSAVLIRAVEPLNGIEHITKLRSKGTIGYSIYDFIKVHVSSVA